MLLSLLCANHSLQAQTSPSLYSYPQNHLPWYTIESEHFLIHFQKGNSRSAQISSRIAEEVYPQITNLYNLEPDSKVSIILNDRLDYSNGAAYFFDNQIEIWLPSLDTPLRGTHNWLRNVISHEFTHIVQLQASMKKSRKVPAIYLQWFSYEDVRRPDILYGFPKGIISYPIASVNVPAWMAEGVAQYQRSGWTYDTWDSHRDMLLRTSILNNTYLGFDEMSTFSSKSSLDREKAYNQGFGFTIYLVDQFGESILAEISRALGQGGVFTVNKALKIATGTSGKTIFNNWIADRKAFYSDAVRSISATKVDPIEEKGFYNFFPSFSAKTNTLAYLSNKGRDESATSLFLKNTSDSTSIAINQTTSSFLPPATLGCELSDKPAVDHIRSSFSFSPDGTNIVFARNTLNNLGEHYNDLFVYNITTAKTRRLTQSKRLHDPAWSPDGSHIVAVKQSQGTTNLFLIDPLNGEEQRLTNFSAGQQVYTPAWHPNGSEIYFAFSDLSGRKIMRYDVSQKTYSTFLEAPYTDFRDPFVGSDGKLLYFSSDKDGIFNIYSTPLKGGETRQLTNVLGGAFMPFVKSSGELLFAHFKKGGYKISSVDLNRITLKGHYAPTYKESLASAPNDSLLSAINNFDDSDINAFSEATYSRSDTASVSFSTSKTATPDQQKFYAYEETFTKLSFFPIIRFDNYSKLNGSNDRLIREGRLGDLGENLYRDLKIGTYFSSREVINRLTLFGGALFGFGSTTADGVGDFFSPSRLTDLDRDLFLIAEYKGLPFIKKRWSPTIAIEFYNQRRNVRNGLSIQEFPCTSCLPDTLNANIAYDIWEADVFLRSKINDRNLIELGAGYTPYTVQTDGFFSRELNQFIPSSSDEYFRGTIYSASHTYEAFIPYKNSDVAPLGVRTFLKYRYEPGRLLEDFVIENGILSPVFQTSKNHSVEFSTLYGFKTFDKGAWEVYGRFFSYLNNPEDQFYLDYFGGLSGMRSYPFFALGGNTTAFAKFSYTLPLFTGLNKEVGRHTFDKLFLKIFAEAGNGWNNSPTSSNFIKTGLGSELRFAFNTQYLFPLKLFISSAYGFNQFDVALRDEFITTNSSPEITYGKEFIFHFGLTFDFNIFNDD